MTEADFALIGLIYGLLAFCAIGFLVAFPSQIDRMVEWWERRRAGKVAGEGGRSPA